MTTMASIGLSRQEDAWQASSDAATQAMTGIEGPADLVIAFTTDRYDQEAAVQGIRSVTGTAPLIGCCAGGVIAASDLSNDSIAVMALRSEGLRVTLAMEEGIHDAPHRVGQAVAEILVQHLMTAGAEEQSVAVLALADGLTGALTEVVQSATDVLGPMYPMVGGGAGDNLRFFKTFQFINDQVHSDALVAALLRTPAPIGIGVAHGWKPVGRSMVVTRSAANVIYELDGQPAFEVYRRRWADEAPQLDLEGFGAFAMAHPLGLPLIGGEFLIRDPLRAHPDGAIECVAAVPENAVVHVMSGDKDALFTAASVATKRAVDELAGQPPAAAIVFNCISRLMFLGDDAATEIEHIRDILGHETPLIGMFSFGEIAPPLGSGLAALHNKTVVVCTLA